jgi:hypothetical protein
MAAAAVKPQASPVPQVYARRATWAETMLATRAAFLRWQTEQARRPVNADLKPFDSGLISGTAAAQHISINVSGAESLRLIARCEQGGGHLNIWGEARLIAHGGRETRLSSLRPATVSVGWGQLWLNQNWQRQPLAIGDRQFSHGLWLHANSDLVYVLGKKYERFEAWIGIDKARATGAARFRVTFDPPDPLPAAWQQIAQDFPTESQWLIQILGLGRHLDWFREASGTACEEDLVGRVAQQLGAAGGRLQQELGQLRQSHAVADDARWLELYAKGCRWRDSLANVEEVWTPTLPGAIAELSAAMPGEFQDGSRLLARCGELDRQWKQILARFAAVPERQPVLGQTALTPGPSPDQPSVGARGRGKVELVGLDAFRQQVVTLRRDMVLAIAGMRQWLAAPANEGLEQEWERQYQTLQYDLHNRAAFEKFAPETYRREALVLDTDQDPADVVLRRTAALAVELRAKGADVAGLEKDLARLQSAGRKIAVAQSEARYVLFAAACRLRRQIAWRNPLLDFDGLLFVKRHRAIYNHMCDQYYGSTARPGGGLYVLQQPFGPRPQVRDLLAGTKVAAGRLAGQKLCGGSGTLGPPSFDGQGNVGGPEQDGGSFVSPDLSPDGRTILFAYVECTGEREHRHHTDPSRGHWAEGRCYHIFKVGVDGSGLQQLTDGTWNDFAPCWLPNGRIAFISERRGGYLRCGRVCPNYTLFDMAADGNDITCLSFHETNEWDPSVTNDGRIIYTRWDYVDRYGCTAHLPWITTLDGRDARAVHGNFAPRQSRPDMELDVRAIPGSQRFIATAAPHHGQAFGSLVMIDPRVEDDDRMAPVKRITPDVGFPESQGGAEAYATAWPLSEDFYLCSYNPVYVPALNRTSVAGPGDPGSGYPKQPPTRNPNPKGIYGLYLVDSFGNKELIYRDAAIACQSPRPLRPRWMPPTMPMLAGGGAGSNPAARPAATAAKPAEATIAVANVYRSRTPWPAGTRIAALRVIQVLPMSVPSGRPPHDIGMRIATARDSVTLARYVLGTVPVESDGSAYFAVPANKEILFQAVDERGLAIQSMRSATYLHAGEQQACQGCHEPQHHAPMVIEGSPLALRRAPSRLTPDVDGSNPFSYPRLVQPVLDRRCVECHAKNAAKAPNLAREPITRNWYASYANLAPNYGFYDYGSGLVTTPGHFGARASKLLEILDKGHYDVKLSAEELHRLTLWLDCASIFYGVYEKEGGEAQLRGEIVRPTLE